MSDAAVKMALSSLGRGFDLTSDFRLKFCKGHERLVLLNEAQKRELQVPGFGSVDDVSIDIKCSKGDQIRYQSDILNFNQMSELFNQKSSVPGKIPSGFFNAMFGFQSECWASDAENIKNVGLDGFFVTLFDVHIERYPLLLADQVRQAVPSSWNPVALARFIEKYGTHVIVGLSMGGHDVVLVRQERTSKVEASELKKYLDELGDQLFNGACSFTPLDSKAKDHRTKAPQAFNLFDTPALGFTDFSSVSAKDGITVICSKKGGCTAETNHSAWLPTVPSSPDAIYFRFIPITSLLNGVRGKGFLSHAINLYLRYKPPIEDLPCFLDFQVPKIWAPIHNELPLNPAPNITSSPSLHFNMMGPRLYINTSQVRAGKSPVTGMRLYLEGVKCNRLAIHIQHLLKAPFFLENKMEDDTPSYCRGSEDHEEQGYLEAINGTRFSHVCTAPVKYDPKWASTEDDASFIVTGAQLHISKKEDSRHVLHLKLFFSKLSHSRVAQSNWTIGSSRFPQKSGFFSSISTSISSNPEKEILPSAVVDSSVFPTGPPVPMQVKKHLKFVDVSEVSKGPQDSPGHWLVTGARLYLEKGKISLHVKFSLLHIYSP